MRKSVPFLAMAALLVLLTGCGNYKQEQTTQAYTPAVNTMVQQTTTQLRGESQMEKTLYQLLDKNYVCFTELFYLGQLPCEAYDSASGDSAVKVTSDKYKSYADIVSFVNSIYCNAEADRLLNNYLDGKPLYFEKNGVLYEDASLVGGMGYYADWTDYKINITSSTDTECSFTATMKERNSDGMVNDYSVEFKAISENGEWKLVKLAY